MKLNYFERVMTNSPVRGLIQRHIEGPRLRSFARKDSYPECLEIGAGIGRGVEIISGLFGAKRIIATDIDPLMLEKAKKRLSKKPIKGTEIIFKVEDGMNLDEPDSSFDAVYAFGVVHHMEDWRKGIREIKRVLKPGGEYFFSELLRGFLSNPVFMAITAHPEGGLFRGDEFLGYLKEAGLIPSKYTIHGKTWLFGNAVKE
jgi:ubiquinone/menaquinone biosynthesis C-methylase UbiE